MTPDARIPCTVGILTFNSGAHLARALASVAAFDDILIADGGSTDDTLAIAARYDARVIAQTGRGRIRDFAAERNNLLDHARHDWFLYIDADEAASPELVEAVQKITTPPPALPLAGEGGSVKEEGGQSYRFYRIRWQYTDGDMRTMYRTFKHQYQIRLMDRTAGVRFEKPIHERVYPERAGFTVGTLNAAWYTPLDVYLNFAVFKDKVRRNARTAPPWTSKNLLSFVRRCIVPPIVATLKSCIKNGYLRVRYPWRELIPLRYEWYKLYEVWYIAGMYAGQYARLFFS